MFYGGLWEKKNNNNEIYVKRESLNNRTTELCALYRNQTLNGPVDTPQAENNNNSDHRLFKPQKATAARPRWRTDMHAHTCTRTPVNWNDLRTSLRRWRVSSSGMFPTDGSSGQKGFSTVPTGTDVSTCAGGLGLFSSLLPAPRYVPTNMQAICAPFRLMVLWPKCAVHGDFNCTGTLLKFLGFVCVCVCVCVCPGITVMVDGVQLKNIFSVYVHLVCLWLCMGVRLCVWFGFWLWYFFGVYLFCVL